MDYTLSTLSLPISVHTALAGCASVCLNLWLNFYDFENSEG